MKDHNYTDVLIVGAGPVGMLAANVLAGYGLSFRIIDNDPAPTTESRATIVHGRSLELLDKLGLSQAAIHNGQKIVHATLIRNQKVLAEFPISGAEDDPSPFPYSIIHEQWKTEALLNQRLLSLGNAVEWSTRLVQITANLAESEVVIEQPDGSQQTLIARFVVAADGARSPVRQQLGIAFEGDTYEQIAFTADVEMETSALRYAVNLLYFREGFVGFVPLKSESDQAYRLIGTLPDELEAAVRDGRKIEMERRDLEYIFEQRLKTSAKLLAVHQLNIYRLHCRLASTYRHRNVFLAGDAAHIHSPAGGQGMNMGMGDAFNLAWKLAMVVKGWARPDLLDSYQAERRPVAQTVLSGSDKGFALEANKQPLMQFFNNYLLPPIIQLANRLPVARRYNSRLFSQNWINYAKSPNVAAPVGSQGIQPGARVPFATFESGPNQGKTTYELIRGLNHQLMVFCGNGLSDLKAIRNALSGFPMAVDVIEVPRDCPQLNRLFGVAEPTVFLLRPDGHVAYRGSANDLRALEAFLEMVYTRKAVAKSN